MSTRTLEVWGKYEPEHSTKLKHNLIQTCPFMLTICLWDWFYHIGFINRKIHVHVKQTNTAATGKMGNYLQKWYWPTLHNIHSYCTVLNLIARIIHCCVFNRLSARWKAIGRPVSQWVCDNWSVTRIVSGSRNRQSYFNIWPTLEDVMHNGSSTTTI